jgi:hypothetical protein
MGLDMKEFEEMRKPKCHGILWRNLVLNQWEFHHALGGNLSVHELSKLTKDLGSDDWGCLMILLDESRTSKLLRLAYDRFDPALSEAEKKVLRDSASSLDPEDPRQGTLRPPIRPELVRWLASDSEAAIQIDPKGLRINGVTLLDKLDLGTCRAGFALHFFRCTMEDEVNLQFAEIRGLSIVDCAVDGSILADGIDIRGALFLRNSIVSGEVRVVGSKIRADLRRLCTSL